MQQFENWGSQTLYVRVPPEKIYLIYILRRKNYFLKQIFMPEKFVGSKFVLTYNFISCRFIKVPVFKLFRSYIYCTVSMWIQTHRWSESRNVFLKSPFVDLHRKGGGSSYPIYKNTFILMFTKFCFENLRIVISCGTTTMINVTACAKKIFIL